MKQTAKGLSAAGTRHNSTLGMAEWLGYEGVPAQCPGVLFVRSDGGGAKAFFPEPRGKAKAPHPRCVALQNSLYPHTGGDVRCVQRSDPGAGEGLLEESSCADPSGSARR